MRLLHCLVPLVAVAACGDDGSTPVQPDAPKTIDAPPLDPDSGIPAGCDYAETNDAGNDPFAMTPGTPEASNLTLGTSSVFCGKIDNGHFVPGDMGDPGLVDADAYSFTVAADSHAVLSITGAGLETIDTVQIGILDAGGDLFGIATFAGTSGLDLSSLLPAGTYTLVALGVAPADIAAPVDYKVKLVAYDLAARCAPPATPSFTEAGDGATHDGNDMVEVRFVANGATATASTTDMPEATNLTITAGTPVSIRGTSANVNPGNPQTGDEYMDRDTFTITAGAATSHMLVNLTWPGTTADFDFFLFNENMPDINAPGALLTSNTAPETLFVPITEAAKYWLWIGAYDGSTGQPLDYDATICGENFVP